MALSIGITSCEKEELESNEQNTNIELTTKKEIFSFKNWDEFHQLYEKFAKLNMEELQARSFFSYDRNPNISWALQGILNTENKFKLDDKTIWFDDGKFYELDNEEEMATEKSNFKDLKEVGSVSQIPLSYSSDDILEKTVPIANQYQFRKQRYIENCGSGAVQGSSPRAFKYVHEAFAEYLVTGFQHNYGLWLRVKLEYNYKRNRWRPSGEKREISINLTNTSFLTNYFGTNYSIGNGAQNNRTITFSSSCDSDKQIFLNSVSALGLIPNSFWSINVSGTITEKMVGDVPSNRWRDTVNW